MASNGEVWVQWFTCCLTQQGPAARSKRQRPQQQRLRIDRSMIGAPTNFQHTGHIGGGDLADMASAHLSAIQNQMQGKGGYEASFGVKYFVKFFPVECVEDGMSKELERIEKERIKRRKKKMKKMKLFVFSPESRKKRTKKNESK